MAVKTQTRMAGPALVSNSAATKYTVPGSTIAVIRHLHISNPSGSPVDFTLSFGADGTGTRLFDGLAIAADSVYDWYCYQVLAAAEIVQAFAGTNNILTLTISGDQYV
jgi:hypothetical protein